MSSTDKDRKSVQKTFPAIHVLSTTTVASDGTQSIVPMSIIPIYPPGMLPSKGGLIQVPVNIAQSRLYPTPIKIAPAVTTMQASGKTDQRPSLKRKSMDDGDDDDSSAQHRAPHSYLMQQQTLQTIQPRTMKGKVYSWMQNGCPKRQRAQISDAMKKEILEFCKNHTMLKQGEIAEIFGVDRTTVTKMLKRSQELDSEAAGVPVTVLTRSRLPQHELEDFLYRWINSAVKQRLRPEPLWSCEKLLEQAVELQSLTDAGSSFKPDHDWILDFIQRFRIKSLITDYPGDNAKRPSKSKNTFDSPSTSNVQPKKQFNVRQSPSHKIPKENMAEYTIVETPLECVDIKLEPVDTKPVLEELDRETAMNREFKSLETFREQQQVMEEANKQKKALLAKTLTERKHRARKEAHKLEHIQKELSRLDNLLTADVQVIRGKIEDSSREFLDAQKRFEKAETEYIAAKMSLHDKTELKERLTEHLYTIIHQNEVRKAKKLADLMKELEMENGENDDLELPQLPPLTTFQPPHMLLSPTGSKTPPGLSRFKIVEDTIFPIADKSPQTVEAEKELIDKKSEMIIIQPSVRSVQDETNETGDGKGKVKDCDKNGDNTTHEGENPDVNKTLEGLKPDGTETVKDVNSDNDLSVSRDSDDVPTVTEKPSELNETGDNCSGSEPLSESSGSASQHKQSGDKNANTSTTAQGNVTAKSKWEFDGSLS